MAVEIDFCKFVVPQNVHRKKTGGIFDLRNLNSVSDLDKTLARNDPAKFHWISGDDGPEKECDSM